MVTGDPLTPTNVQLKRQTRVGSLTSRHVPPVNVDGATLFIARNAREIREFIYTDIEQAYQSTDLALLSRHLIIRPVDQDFDANRRLLFVFRKDGKMACLTVYRAEAVAAWTLIETDGVVLSVAVVGERVYALVERGDVINIEEFDDTLYLDSALNGESESPADTWGGLEHLEGRTVSIVADGILHDTRVVVDGTVNLDVAVHNVVIGLPYTHVVEPLPPSLVAEAGAGRAVRLVEAIFRIQDTASLRLDVGRGLRDIPLRQIGDGLALDERPPLISGDIRVRAIGWNANGANAQWRVEQSTALPFTLLSVTTEMKVND